MTSKGFSTKIIIPQILEGHILLALNVTSAMAKKRKANANPSVLPRRRKKKTQVSTTTAMSSLHNEPYGSGSFGNSTKHDIHSSGANIAWKDNANEYEPSLLIHTVIHLLIQLQAFSSKINPLNIRGIYLTPYSMIFSLTFSESSKRCARILARNISLERCMSTTGRIPVQWS